MSAQHIYMSAPLGSIIRYSDGTPKPPARFKRKLAAWENNNSGGRLVRKTPSRDMPSCFLPASITLHQGDFGSAGVVVLRAYKTFSVDCALTFTVSEPPKAGSVRILDREGEAAELSISPPIAPRWKHGLRRIAIPTPCWKTSRRTRSPRLRSKGGRHEHVLRLHLDAQPDPSSNGSYVCPHR
jgi:hypothetical protein